MSKEIGGAFEDVVMDSFSVPKLCLGHPTKGFPVFPGFRANKGFEIKGDARDLCRSD